jgi:hypothetical protein
MVPRVWHIGNMVHRVWHTRYNLHYLKKDLKYRLKYKHTGATGKLPLVPVVGVVSIEASRYHWCTTMVPWYVYHGTVPTRQRCTMVLVPVVPYHGMDQQGMQYVHVPGILCIASIPLVPHIWYHGSSARYRHGITDGTDTYPCHTTVLVPWYVHVYVHMSHDTLASTRSLAGYYHWYGIPLDT